MASASFTLNVQDYKNHNAEISNKAYEGPTDSIRAPLVLGLPPLFTCFSHDFCLLSLKHKA